MPKQFKRCYMILADGARPDVMEAELKKGNLPNISRYLVEPGLFQPMTTVFPSTTGPAYLPYLTGCFPGTCNVPGIRWFDKDHYAEHGWGFKSFRSYVGLETFLMGRDTKEGIPSAFDLFDKPVSLFNMVHKGVKARYNLTRFSRIWYLYYAHLTDRWAFVDEAATRKFLAFAKEDPDFAFIAYPAIDEYSHQSSPFHPRTLQAYAELDKHVGKIVEFLKKQGWLDSTLLAIFSDHGLSETRHHFDIGPHLEEKGLRTFFYSQIFKFRFEASSMVSGNGMTHLYFKGDHGWKGRMPVEEISRRSLLIDELRMRPEVDVVAGQGSDGSFHIFSSRGYGAFKATATEIDYEWKHADPLGIFDNHPGRHIRMTWDESYLKTINTHYPDIFVQLIQVFRSPRTGDLIVSAKSGSDLRFKYEHPEHKASHGALCSEHMKIPLVFNYPINQKVIRSVDILPTVLTLMGKDIPAGMDGRSLV